MAFAIDVTTRVEESPHAMVVAKGCCGRSTRQEKAYVNNAAQEPHRTIVVAAENVAPSGTVSSSRVFTEALLGALTEALTRALIRGL